MENCLICHKPVYKFEYEYCCTGHDCGCQGQPIEPCICSSECWLALIDNVGTDMESRRIMNNIKEFPKIGASDFVIKGKNADSKKFNGEIADLIALVAKHWDNRAPGVGRADTSQVVVVNIKEHNLKDLFNSSWGNITDAKYIRGKVVRRQDHEDPFIDMKGKGNPLPVKYVRVVLYSRETLLENNGQASGGDYDWEIVAILTGPWETEPMTPLTMARNYLQKPGGTFAPYTAEQFAESIYFWSGFIRVKP
jgi:hypothetical protein